MIPKVHAPQNQISDPEIRITQATIPFLISNLLRPQVYSSKFIFW